MDPEVFLLPIYRATTYPPRIKKPTLFKKIKTYAKALTKWTQNKFLIRSDSEVKIIFEKYCSKCKLYDNDTKTCNKCGCRVNVNTIPVLNKIKMGTEHCPLRLW